ncbi:MAG: hypothetical protein AAF664_13065 [Planctomycetota bacterium]
MFAKDFNISDLERLGPIIEQLLGSGKLTDDEAWAVHLACRAATDLASIRHLDVAQRFYSRSDIEAQSESTTESWLEKNADAEPGTVAMICGRVNVASIGTDGKLQLTPVFDL